MAQFEEVNDTQVGAVSMVWVSARLSMEKKTEQLKVEGH